MPGTDPQDYILFVTACGCSRMHRCFPGWRQDPIMHTHLASPARPVYDWVNPPTDDLLTTNVATRSFRLEAQEAVGPNHRVFTYREIL